MLFSILIILIFPLRSDIISARTRQPPASVTPVLARAGEVRDNIYTQPLVTRAQVSRGASNDMTILHVVTRAWVRGPSHSSR